MKDFAINDSHDFTSKPVFIQKAGKLVGMIKRSDFNNLYPVSVDRVEAFEKTPVTLRLTDVNVYLISLGYNLVIE